MTPEHLEERHLALCPISLEMGDLLFARRGRATTLLYGWIAE